MDVYHEVYYVPSLQFKMYGLKAAKHSNEKKYQQAGGINRQPGAIKVNAHL